MDCAENTLPHVRLAVQSNCIGIGITLKINVFMVTKEQNKNTLLSADIILILGKE
jgi:hypothetical protein